MDESSCIIRIGGFILKDVVKSESLTKEFIFELVSDIRAELQRFGKMKDIVCQSKSVFLDIIISLIKEMVLVMSLYALNLYNHQRELSIT